MTGNIALDTSVAIRYLNGERVAVTKVLALPTVMFTVTCSGRVIIWGRKFRTFPKKFDSLLTIY